MAKTVKNTENAPQDAAAAAPKKTRAKKVDQSSEIVAPEPTPVEPVFMTQEQYEEALNAKIAGEIKRFNIAEQGIDDLKDKYKDLSVPAVTDKAGIKLVKEALSEVNGIMKAIEDKRVLIKADYLKTGRAIDAEAARLTSLIEPLKLEIKAKKDEIDRLEREEKERKAREEQEKLDSRVDAIKAAGMVYDGNFYVIGATMSMDISTLKGLKDSDFMALVAKIEIENARLQKIKEDEQRAEEERKEKERLEREAFEKQQEEFKKQQEEFARQQEEFAAQQRKAEQEERERQEKIREEERRKEEEERQRVEIARQKKIASRVEVLEALGLSFQPSKSTWVYQNEGGSYSVDSGVLEASQEYWNSVVTDVKDEITRIDAAKEYVLENQRELAAERAREEERQRIENERLEREAQEAEAARLEEERLAKLPDLEKVFSYLMALICVPTPEPADPEAQSFISTIRETLDEARTAVANELSKNMTGE